MDKSIYSNQSDIISYSSFLEKASGKVSYKPTNDYLFHATLLENNNVLKALLCSLLRLRMEEISSVTITNPIEFGKFIDAKNFILDIRLIMNNSTMVNLEMQIINKGDWPERSLCYLCRSFDNLNKGDDYHKPHPAIHIGILDFILFPQYPEFYSSYLMMNEKNYTVYSDKLHLYVLNLPQNHLATETDRIYQLDDWAALFKAATWEDVKMIAAKNQYMHEAAETMYRLSQDEKIRLQCEARERYYRDQRTTKHRFEEQEAELREKDTQLQQKECEIQKKNAEIQELKAEIQELKAEIARLCAALEKLQDK